VDVGPRDGLQNAPNVLVPAARAALVRRLASAGVARIEAVSFVRGSRVPQMAGAEEVIEALKPAAKARSCGLVLNEQGYDRLRASGLGRFRFAFAASDAFNLRNSNATTAAGVVTAEALLARGRSDAISGGVVIATSFGCPFQGQVDPGYVVEIAGLLAAAGADEIVFADTIGVAVPSQIRRIIEPASRLGRVGVHLHNTRSTGYANAYAGLEAGARIFDSSIGGLGGCPFAPGASGNIATEDLLYLLEGEGIETGADLDALIATTVWLRDTFGLAPEGQLHRVGRSPAHAAAGRAGSASAANAASRC
jgi:hydroxymethylglutaryl-CoA lyase/(R)-citramalyl-CoA lyase